MKLLRCDIMNLTWRTFNFDVWDRIEPEPRDRVYSEVRDVVWASLCDGTWEPIDAQIKEEIK